MRNTGPGGEPREEGHQQRRAELRIALQPGRQVEPLRSTDAPLPLGKHLSARERAEMREQLRLLQMEVRRPAP